MLHRKKARSAAPVTESKEPSQGPTENCRLENAIPQPFAEINTGMIQLFNICIDLVPYKHEMYHFLFCFTFLIPLELLLLADIKN